MKLFLWFTILINALVFSHVAVSEENSEDKEWTTSIGLTGLFLRKAINENNGIFAGIRYSLYKYDGPTNTTDSTDQRLGVEIGHRYYFSKSDIYTFIDSSFSYDLSTSSQDGIDNNHYYGLNFKYGLEKFISDQFSIEGAAGVGLQYHDYKDSNSVAFYFPRIRVAVNYYF